MPLIPLATRKAALNPDDSHRGLVMPRSDGVDSGILNGSSIGSSIKHCGKPQAESQKLL